ncbi:4-hydroxy-tetrahydrodipicolinate synthase [Halodesulfovibrio sp. MK-HDV]|jgi:4-hydroxy-tetrahydrodipicolinate synthase|uniref:4-hydroxy-tetrahydrodipicolinate synthase n=1 Tax=Halodesulfovibrio sp. MK-HDV TaxID=2599925 RepID=UPI00136FE627|nr:4-hydroxy-tetrahydrodipicolinate synthase [Halodesulfovibrio sp. MK-HDV]KAF1074745.1 4-hydroxy-tetrahydrodipicolinate synthase [Halodesulfovibrio sp. MK-HDV]
MNFSGAYTALVTPFQDGKIDEDRFRAHIEWQITEGIHGLVPCGTTGESATLTHDEHKEAIRICVDQANKRVPVLAGAGSNNTKEAVHLTQFAKEAGADGVLLISPYYNKPTQEGIYQHFKYIADTISMPMVLYNVPGRTGSNIMPSTVARLHKDIPQIVGIKEATGNLIQVSDLIEQCGASLNVLSGDDFTLLPLLSIGGAGVISVVSNLLPNKMASLCNAWNEGDISTARKLHFEMQPLNRAMFMESNPIPVKTALALQGKMDTDFRLPMVPLADENLKKLKAVLVDSGLL